MFSLYLDIELEVLGSRSRKRARYEPTPEWFPYEDRVVSTCVIFDILLITIFFPFVDVYIRCFSSYSSVYLFRPAEKNCFVGHVIFGHKGHSVRVCHEGLGYGPPGSFWGTKYSLRGSVGAHLLCE